MNTQKIEAPVIDKMSDNLDAEPGHIKLTNKNRQHKEM